eukprot:3372898-Pleurochrysis_carterae.AAC.1
MHAGGSVRACVRACVRARTHIEAFIGSDARDQRGFSFQRRRLRNDGKFRRRHRSESRRSGTGHSEISSS